MLFRNIDKRLLTFCLVLIMYSIDLSAEQSVQFKDDLNQTTTTGYCLIKWELPNASQVPAATFVLQQSNDPTFKSNKILYEGPDLASFVSGLANGEYYYRVGTKNETHQVSDWSTPLHLKVEHHSRRLALALFTTGIIIFFATVAVIVVGNLKYNK